jgi:hypothetical protein
VAIKVKIYLFVSTQGDVQDAVNKLLVGKAAMLGRLGHFLAVGEVGVGISLEDDNFVVVRKSKVDSAVIP